MRADDTETGTGALAVAAPLLGPFLDGLVGDVERLRVRVKPGTSAALAARRPDGELLLALAYAPHAAAKVAKTARKAGDDLVALAETDGVVVVHARADRDLPGLRSLGELDGVVTPLSYNPQRRFVGRVRGGDGARVVRVVRPSEHAVTTRGARALDGAAGTPRLLAEQPRSGVARLSWVPGRPLDAGASAADLAAAGAALARLHAAPAALPPLTGTQAAPRATARLLAHLLPRLRPRLVRLAGAVERGLADAARDGLAAGPRPLHGDLSRDQLVVGPDGVGILDLDRAGAGDVAYDLGSLLADDRARGHAGGEVLLAAYAEHAPAPRPDALAAHTAAHLLRRSAEPFRTCRPDWPAECVALVEEVERLCSVTTP
ncbi:phosphotransferase [Nocardioides zeae]|uniref:Phosphotransferase n=1 Tax=Nocardioides imazamoxiresistens TaxID=3231893 RepID=A0ABU3Q1J7_9ACTN|nr:phosphotransferase [Nocardioides zeae]MDT9595259.1 phosphotransferase [Nocardioides zeae]